MVSATGRLEQRDRGRTGRPSRGRGALAALDLGTNNCRLLVAEPERGGADFRVIDAFSRAVRLGEGMNGSGFLSEAAQARAIKALHICAGKIRRHGARRLRMIATEACRRAENGTDFVARAAGATGLELDIIGAEEEARLAVAGCAPLISSQASQVLVFDIGGGSTELIWVDLSDIAPERRQAAVRGLSPHDGRTRAGARGASGQVSDWISVPMGVSTLTDQFAGIGCERTRFAAMAGLFEEALTPFAPYDAADREALISGLQIIGVSGTATTFGALDLGLASYDRARVDGLWLPRARVDALTARLLELGPERRARHPGIGQGRAELLLAGAAIMTTILRIWPVEAMRVADRGLREGMLYALLAGRGRA